MPDGHLVRRGGFNKPENEQSQTDHKYHVFPPCRPCVSRRDPSWEGPLSGEAWS